MSRKKHTAQFKFNCVMETFKEESVSSVARKYGLNANQLSTWRKQFLDNGHGVFEITADKEKKDLKKQVGKLEQIIGKKEVELNLIKNFADFHSSQSGN
jgi:transposase-like protein